MSLPAIKVIDPVNKLLRRLQCILQKYDLRMIFHGKNADYVTPADRREPDRGFHHAVLRRIRPLCVLKVLFEQLDELIFALIRLLQRIFHGIPLSIVRPNVCPCVVDTFNTA